MNINYKRSRARETKLKKALEKEGYYSIRAAGSKGIADVIAIKPAKCGNAFHYEVRFLQVKVSEKLRKIQHLYTVKDSPCGMINVEFIKYPVKSKKWHEHTRHLNKRTVKKRIPPSK
jgi:Holliday junction resolvase